MTNYPPVTGDPENDDGTMPENVEFFANAIIGHKIVDISHGTYKEGWRNADSVTLTLDNGTTVDLVDEDDCCAYTAIDEVIELLPMAEHIITAVKPNDEYTEWHVLADFGEVMKLKVDWSCGNPFYYSYGFYIRVKNSDGIKTSDDWFLND